MVFITPDVDDKFFGWEETHEYSSQMSLKYRGAHQLFHDPLMPSPPVRSEDNLQEAALAFHYVGPGV